MFDKTKAIVLRTVKYQDHSLIATVYSEKFGRISVIFREKYSSKKKKRIVHPLSLLEVVLYNHPKRSIHTVKEYTIYNMYETIIFNVYKSCIAMFLAEVLYKVLKEEVSNKLLYNFLQNSFIYLDRNDKTTSFFHLNFLISLTQYIGIQPRSNYSKATPYFDMQAGHFITQNDKKFVLNKSESKTIYLLLQAKNLSETIPAATSKYSLLRLIIKYYSLHISNINNLKTLEVLNQVYQ